MTNEEKYTAIMVALGKITKSLEINLQFDGENFEEMLFQFAVECKQYANNSWISMFEEIVGFEPSGIADASEYLKSTVSTKKKARGAPS